MPIASGAGHWPKEHVVAAAVEKAAQPASPSYVQSYMPQWTPPNKILPQKPSYITQGPSQPQTPHSNYPKYPSQPGSPTNGQPYPQYETPPPRYSSANPKDPGSPRDPRYNERNPYGRPPNQQSKPPRSWRATEKYGQGGHHRFGNGGPSTRTDFGHNRYGVQYNSTRQVVNPMKGTRPVGPKGLESYEMYGPRMNMTTGCCGPQMRPLWAMLGGLLALAALGGIIAGIVLGVKSTLPPPVRKLPYVGPIGSVRYYQQNGAFEPCLDRFAKTTPTPTTPRPTTPRATTTAKPTVLPTTTHCVPITIGVKPTVPVTTQQSGTTKLGTTKITQKPTVPLTTVCIWTDPPPTTTRITTTVETTTTVPTTTTTLPPTTTTTLPFCDTLTTSYTLITLYPLPSPVIYSGARPSSPTGAGLLCLLLLAFVTKLSVD